MSLVEWELFLPDRYKVSGFEGNAMPAELAGGLPRAESEQIGVGGMAEIVEVKTAEKEGFRAPARMPSGQAGEAGKGRDSNEPQQIAPSSNVFALQRRVAGVLPVRIDIPHAGASYRFARPLVLDEETTVRFRYKAGR